MIDRLTRIFMVIGGVSGVCALTWPGMFPVGDPAAVLVRYDTPDFHRAVATSHPAWPRCLPASSSSARPGSGSPDGAAGWGSAPMPDVLDAQHPVDQLIDDVDGPRAAREDGPRVLHRRAPLHEGSDKPLGRLSNRTGFNVEAKLRPRRNAAMLTDQGDPFRVAAGSAQRFELLLAGLQVRDHQSPVPRAAWSSASKTWLKIKAAPNPPVTEGAVANRTEAAYARSDLFEQHRRLMDEWADYLSGQRGPKVPPRRHTASVRPHRWRAASNTPSR